ncbi:MAG: diphthine synthase [Candidatus Altiarchaeota archaeon]|nr:diphthine synthase [Candidatus Altiarchaeota archaeon]
MLYLIGLGIHDEEDISLRSLNILKKIDKVYAEFYTNAFNGDLGRLEGLIGKKILILSRQDLEERPDENILKYSLKEDAALLVSGDPMIATTHSDIVLRAGKSGIKTRVIHSSSIYSAVMETGLQAYNFGKTASIPYPEKGYHPTSFYDVLRDNLKLGAHTLFLLDVRAEEDRYMTVNDAIRILLQIEEKRRESIFTEETLCIGAARLGGDSLIRYGKAKDVKDYDFGKPPHILVVPGRLHFMEEEMLETLTHK